MESNKLKSRKFWITVLSALALAATGNIPAAAGIVSIYLGGQSVVDATAAYKGKK